MDEIWTRIENMNYCVSDLGRIKNVKSGHILSTHVDDKGYHRVALWINGKSKQYKIHVLVAKYHIGMRPEGLVIDHIDGNKQNNRVENLRYVTLQENSKHAALMGFHAQKLSVNDITHVVNLYKEGYPTDFIARGFRVEESTIRGIVNGDIWTHITGGKITRSLPAIQISRHVDYNTSPENELNEIWKELDSSYAASSHGRVKRIKASGGVMAGKIIKPKLSRGYLCVSLRCTRKRIYRQIHSLVTDAFLGRRPDGHVVNHIDGNKLNNCIENLEYVTPSENMRKYYDNLKRNRA